MFKSRKRSFTFVETLVVIAVIGLILPTLFSLFFVLLRQQLRVYAIAEVTRQGDYINTILENAIRNNAYQIFNSTSTEVCDAKLAIPTSNISFFRDKYNTRFSFDYDISSGSLTITPSGPSGLAPTLAMTNGTLNSSRVKISPFSLSCTRSNQYSAPLVTVSYKICYKINGICPVSGDQKFSLTYTNYIKLRNFPTQ